MTVSKLLESKHVAHVPITFHNIWQIKINLSQGQILSCSVKNYRAGGNIAIKLDKFKKLRHLLSQPPKLTLHLALQI